MALTITNKARITPPIERQPLTGWQRLNTIALTSTAGLSAAGTYVHLLPTGIPADSVSVFSFDAEPTFDLDLCLLAGAGVAAETVDLRIWGITEVTSVGEYAVDYVGTLRATLGTATVQTGSKLPNPGVWAATWAATDQELPTAPALIFDPANHKGVVRIRHNFNGFIINSQASAASRNVVVLGRFVNGSK
jgi:hypothetical protein